MIKDKVVIITGASSGIGAATAKLLAGEGAKVILGARREEKLKQLVDEIQNAGGQAVYQVLNVVDPADNDAIVQLAKETFGGVDVIFLNAGLMPSSTCSALKTDEWNEMVVTGPHELNAFKNVYPKKFGFEISNEDQTHILYKLNIKNQIAKLRKEYFIFQLSLRISFFWWGKPHPTV